MKTYGTKYKFENKCVHISTVQLFKLKLEAYLEEVCHFGISVNESLICDRGFENMVQVKGEGSTLAGDGVYWGRVNKDLVLNFIGAVDYMPIVGALPLCECFGMKWFVNPPADSSCSSFGSYRPAWAIGTPGRPSTTTH